MQMGEKNDALNSFLRSEALFPTEFEWIDRAKLYVNMGVVFEEYVVGNDNRGSRARLQRADDVLDERQLLV